MKQIFILLVGVFIGSIVMKSLTNKEETIHQRELDSLLLKHLGVNAWITTKDTIIFDSLGMKVWGGKFDKLVKYEPIHEPRLFNNGYSNE